MQRYQVGVCHAVMKQILGFLCINVLISFALSCKKNDSVRPGFSDSITGTWELRHASSAMNPNISVLPPGNGHILQFSTTDYKRFEAGQLVKTGKYATVDDPTVEASVCLLFPIGQFTNRIIYDNDTTGEKQFIHILDGRLVIVAGCYALDAGHRLEYEKIEEPAD